MARNLMYIKRLVFLFAAITLIGCGMTDDDMPADEVALEGDYGPEFETRRAALTDFCSVRVDGYGTLNVEEEYLAQVVTCEHSGAPMETLKAQAIAARGYAKYVTEVEGRPLSPTVRDQAYNCGRPATAAARQAVRETSGMILTHKGKMIMPFYVAGSTNINPNTCRARDNAGTQKYVTYNTGRVGARVQGSTLGWVGNPANRGAMSQNGSACLARAGWKAERILRAFYGDDIRVTKLSGSCVQADTDPDLGHGGGVSTPSDPGQSCDDGDVGRPTIITRSQWGARAPRGNRPRHTPNRFSIHHTVTANNPRDGKAAARHVQNIHMNGNGWSDVGYHYMIDQQGRIYAGNPVDRMGAHVANANSGNIGISFLGQFQPPSALGIRAIQPSDASLRAAGKLIRYLADKYNITVTDAKVKGHRDQGSTSCPGQNLYNKLGTIRDYARATGGGGSCEDSTPGGGPAEFKHIRVRHVSDNPRGYNDTIEGFEVDSIFGQSADGNANYFAQSTSTTGTVTNPNAAKGRPDNNSCASRSSTVAGVQAGGALIATLGTALKPGDRVRVVQSNYHSGMSDCAPGGAAEIAISADKINWIILGQSVSGNTTLTVKKSSLQITKPLDAASTGHSVDFAVSASSDITRVDYLADGWKMGSSTQGPGFDFNYDIQYAGVRQIQARGYNARGELVATDKITISVANGSTLRITAPSANSRHRAHVAFTASASADITRVEYLADDWSLGSTPQGPDFAHSYAFQYTGVRAIEARGFNAAGKMVAVDKLNITVGRGATLSIINPLDGSENDRDVNFKARASRDIVKVEYLADDWSLGNSTNSASSFPLNYSFDYTGVRAIEARGYNAAGDVVAVDRVSIRVKDQAFVKFTKPTNGSTQGHSLQFAVRASDDVVEVEYLADDWSLGRSQRTSTFPHTANIQYPGARRLEARAYNAAGDIIAVDRITVTVKSAGGSTDSAMASALGREGGTCSNIGNGSGGPRCSGGRGGWSTGSCWAFVKAAMIRAGLATRADINRLAASVGMSAYSVQISAAGFKRAADRASASVLRDTMGLKKVHMPVGQAPRGAVIAWAPGCRGAHSQYGHIEVAMGDGYACSDYCGRVRADATCASVYVPVN